MSTRGEREYWIDWTDFHFPKIRHIKWATEYTDPQTFSECKKELDNHYAVIIEDAQEQRNLFRRMKKSEVETEENSDEF
jgi:hypothetical protein